MRAHPPGVRGRPGPRREPEWARTDAASRQSPADLAGVHVDKRGKESPDHVERDAGTRGTARDEPEPGGPGPDRLDAQAVRGR
jgi:hypothetical protein